MRGIHPIAYIRRQVPEYISSTDSPFPHHNQHHATMYNLSTTPFIRTLTTSVPHALRVLCLASFTPAFILLLIGGIASEKVNPAIGILPLFFSAVYSAMSLVYEKKCTCSAAGLTGTPLHMMLDMLCGIGLLLCLILGWVSMGGRIYDFGWPTILSTYGTTFMIFNG